MKAALSALASGRVVAAATESFFGLLCDATRADALSRLFALKPRSAGVALMVPERHLWLDLVENVPDSADRLADAFWPGPLTIALKARHTVDPRLTVDGTVGVRLPGPSAAAEIAARFGRALTATSANPHGEPPATRDAEVAAYFSDAIASGDLVVAPGEAPGGLPSTVVVIADGGPVIARAGAVPEADIRQAVGARL